MAGGKNKPRKGSMAFYPRVRAKSMIPKFTYFGKDIDNSSCKPLCFFAVKAGMTHVIAKNTREKTSNYGQEMSIDSTIVETPDMKVIGARFYLHNKSVSGKKAVFEFTNQEKDIKKTIKGKKQKNIKNIDEVLKRKDEADSLVLIATVNVKETSADGKKPVIVEIPLSGDYESQIKYLQDKLNKTISVDEVFEKDIYLDAKAISIGHGIQGPVKRFGIKVQRPKHQQIQRHVGSINPWHPATIMFTVPRAGQHGCHNRTTYNKKLLMIDDDATKINPSKGLKNYGVVKNKYMLVAGTIPGPVKRVIAFRKAVRPVKAKLEIADITHIAK